MKTEKFKDLYFFHQKSKIKAGDGLAIGDYPFYTSSQKLSKWLNKSLFNTRALIFGTGGNASIHFADGKFSASSDCLVASSKQQFMNIKFVYYYLFGNLHILERGFKGAGIKHISRKYIENINIPVLSLVAQNKIVSILDKAKLIIEKRENSIRLLDDLLRAVFLDMFGDSFTNPKKWTQEPLGKNLNFITSGSRGWAKYYNENGDLFLRINNLGYNELLLNDMIKVKDPSNSESIRTEVYEGDVLLSITADIGRTAVIPVGFPKAFVNQHIAILRINKKLNPFYLSGFLSSNGGRQLLQKYSKGAAKSGLNFSDIKALIISIPNKEFQDQFETIYLSIFAKKMKIFESKIILELLFKSVFNKAFNSDLNFNIDFELEALVSQIDLLNKENDLSKITTDKVYLQRLIDMLNNQEFKDKDLYDKAKHTVFQLLKEGKNIIQEFIEENKSIKLSLNEVT